MAQQAADQVHIQPRSIERFHGKRVPGHMHPQRERKTEPAPTDIMHDIHMESLKEQGLTPGKNQSGMGHSSTTVLNTERLWQDKNAPQWGSGK